MARYGVFRSRWLPPPPVQAPALGALSYEFGRTVHLLTTPGATGNVVAPAGTTAVRIQSWGGGAGANGTGYGGGGGGYAEVTLYAVATDVIHYSVGAGGAGTTSGSAGSSGGDTWGRMNTNSAPTTTAQGALGAGGFNNVGPGGGGTTATSVGTIEYRGGNTSTAPTYDGGGGGAGSTAQGGDGTSANGVAGAGGAGAPGEAGGNGGVGVGSGAGFPGQAPGGGGGAAISAALGGSGAGGQIRITFYHAIKRWDISDKGSEIDLSNRGLTVTRRGTYTVNTYNNARGNTALTNKTYYEVKIDSGFGDTGDYVFAVGFANVSVGTENGDWLGGGPDGVGAWSGSADDVYYNGSNAGAWSPTSALSPGDIIGVLYDPAADLFWARKNGGDWNDDPTADPATGTGGYSAAITGTVYAAFSIKGGGSGVATARFAEADWTYAPPDNFLEIGGVTWDPFNLGNRITLTNNYLTGQSIGSEDLSTSRSNVAMDAGTDYYFEVVATAVANGNFVVGVVNSTKDLDDWVASGTSDGIGVNPDGNVYWNGGNNGTGVIPAWDDGDIVCVHYKRSDETIRFRVNNGTWTSYYDVSTFFTGDTVYAATNGGVTGNTYTAAFATASWTYAAPSGAVQISGVSSGTTYNLTVSETIATSDSASVTITMTATVAETMAVSDAQTAVLAIVAAVAESIATSDAQTVTIAITASVNESMTVADSAISSLAITATVSESMGVADAAAATHAMVSTIAESIGVADSSTNTLAAVAAVAESVGVADSSTNSIAMVATRDEALAVSESITNSIAMTASVAESVGAADSSIGGLLITAAVDESIGIADAASASKTINATVAESIGVADSAAATAAMTASVAETVGVADSATNAVAMTATVDETVAIEEYVTSSLTPGGGGGDDEFEYKVGGPSVADLKQTDNVATPHRVHKRTK